MIYVMLGCFWFAMVLATIADGFNFRAWGIGILITALLVYPHE